ncbi:MAG: hypothetical protein AAFQ94_22960 [Bacteroidota bacterium]
MAFNGRGFRKIVIDGKNYRWKFDQILIVIRENKKNDRLEVDIGWYDEWLYLNDLENKPKSTFPESVTPSFVKDAVMFASKSGWISGSCYLLHRSDVFSVR